MATHKFDPDKAGMLTSPLRRLMLSTRRVFRDVRPKKTDTWADIGCGNGYFTIPLAQMVDRVYAVDISDKMLEQLKSELARKGIDNVQTVQSDESRIPLDDGLLDGALMAFVAHELDEPAETLREAARLLKPGGRLVILEFAKVLSLGPPMSHRLEPEQVERWAVAAGLRKGSSWRWGRAKVGWEYVKPESPLTTPDR